MLYTCRPCSTVPDELRKKVRSKTCSVDGCGLKHRGLGYCRMHYERYKRHGDPLKVLPRGYAPRTRKQCSLAACARPMRAGQLCERHYRQALKRQRNQQLSQKEAA